LWDATKDDCPQIARIYAVVSLKQNETKILPPRSGDPASSLDEGSSDPAARVNVVKRILLTTLVPRLIQSCAWAGSYKETLRRTKISQMDRFSR